MSFETEEIFLTEPESGRKFFVETTKSGEVTRDWVLLLHGLGDHLGRHEWVKKLLTSRGFGVLGIDWVGCGKSDGIRGDLPTVPEGSGMVALAVRETGVTLSGALGHSTGGFFLMRFLQEESEAFSHLRWAWFSSPLIRPDANHGPFKVAAARLFGKLLPHLTLSTHVRRDDCYHTAPEEDAAHLPEGCHNRVSLRFGAHLLEEAQKGAELGAQLPPSLRYLFTIGLSDHICPPQYGENCYLALPTEARTLIAKSGARHEPFREPDRAEFLDAIGLWLDQHG
jgi:alpha-beta hydrolase superfamily lysophospholipase